MKTIVVEKTYNDQDIHYVLLKGFKKECLDSVVIIGIANKYIDSVSSGSCSMIKFFSSDNNFIPGEISQDINIYKDCLVAIKLDGKEIKSFMFFDDNGSMKYFGPYWLPNGIHTN